MDIVARLGVHRDTVVQLEAGHIRETEDEARTKHVARLDVHQFEDAVELALRLGRLEGANRVREKAS